MHTTVLRFIYFAITVAVLLVVLKMINWLPLIIQKESMRQYHSIEEMQSRLNIATVYIPSYFPQHLAWPPSIIIAQRKPFTAVIMHFHYRNSEEVGMVIRQVRAGELALPDSALALRKVLQTSSILIKDRNALLETGECDGGASCSRVSWEEGGLSIAVTAKTPQRELIRIARSMIPSR